MTPTRLVLAFAVAGVAASLYMKSRRGTGLLSGPSADTSDNTTTSAANNATASAVPAPDDQPSSAAGAQTGTPAGTSDTPAATTAGAESPNAAERLQAQGVAQTAGEGRPDDLFQSTSQDSPYARSSGLPDFTRGA